MREFLRKEYEIYPVGWWILALGYPVIWTAIGMDLYGEMSLSWFLWEAGLSILPLVVLVHYLNLFLRWKWRWLVRFTEKGSRIQRD